MAAPDNQPARRLRSGPDVSASVLLDWAADYRFIREVERLEREGRVKSRGDLENTLGMGFGHLTRVRRGTHSLKLSHLTRFKHYYNADTRYITEGLRVTGEAEHLAWRNGQQLDLRQTVWEEGRPVKLDKPLQPYTYAYGQPAGWRIGPQPEDDPRHFPADPTGALWMPDEDAPAAVLRFYEQYRAERPGLPWQQFDNVVVGRGKPAKEGVTEDSAREAIRLHAYLSEPIDPARPERGTRYERYKKALGALPAFRHPEGHMQAGKANGRLYNWWATGKIRLTEGEVSAMREWLRAETQNPDL